MKSISFLFAAILAGLLFIACKDAKTNGTESAETTAVVITADSLQGIKTNLTQQISTMQAMLAAKVSEIEASIAATDNETARQELNTFLEKLKKAEVALQETTAKINAATSETWATVETEMMPALHDAKSLITSGGMSTSPDGSTTTTTAEKK